uniref:Serpin domain-containing protein n=1 Tax=Pavo cristatus TaxID=9049 RepID=A0A8C9G0Y7_PAVCR
MLNLLPTAWEKSFDSANTYEDDFFVNANESVRVNMMQRESDYNSYYDRDLSCEVIELPYKGTAEALFILPDDGKMKQVENALSKETTTMLHYCFFSLFNRKLHLHLPRISISGSYDVKDLFMEMGITDVFSSNADLSGISGSHTLQVSQVSGWTDPVMVWQLVFLTNFISKSHYYIQGLP